MSPEFNEEEYLDVLQNIETSLSTAYRDNPGMVDWDTLKALDGLIRKYQAEASGRAAPTLRLNELAQKASDAAQAMCEFRLGRSSLAHQDGRKADLPIEPITIPEIVACLKRIKRSVEMWQKEGGRRGYYEFIRQFVGK